MTLSRLLRKTKNTIIVNNPAPPTPSGLLGKRGASSFLGLNDTPTTYSGQAGLYARVKAAEDGLEFVDVNTVDGTAVGQMAYWDGTNRIHTEISELFWNDTTKVMSFGNFPITPSSAPTSDYEVANKKYVDDSSPAIVWGGITGTLSNQTDLQAGLDAKQETLVSGTNIKTINGNPVLGSGDLTLTEGLWEVDANGNATLISSDDVFIKPDKKLYFDYNV